jgi:hypothetical protein
LFQVNLARDVDSEIRGPFGVAHFELQDRAVPLKRKPFRIAGEKEATFKLLVDKFQKKGWIEPSESELGSQAFRVSKAAGEQADAWKMVVDYRYLYSVTKDFPYPLPLIEDLICKESGNRISSIFDLEAGFHQMHLAEASRPLTAFDKPSGLYQWTVLPMGVKQGPALFQRMINWTLRSVKCGRAWVEDRIVLSHELFPDDPSELCLCYSHVLETSLLLSIL